MKTADELETTIALVCGPYADSPCDAQLRRAWRVLGAGLTKQLQGHTRPGLRPWGYWIYERGLDEEPDGYVEGVRYLA